MVKIAKAPSGFYTAKEAMRRLGMSRSTFFAYVKDGSIQKTLHPNRKEGYYEKKIIDTMAQENALFTLIHSIEPITFDCAQTEEDIKGIVDLCIDIYGQGGTPSYDARLEIWQKNPEVYYIVRQEGIVAGYMSLIWFDEEALSVLMGPTPKQPRISSAGTGVYSMTGPEHVHAFVEGQPIESLFISIGVRPGFSSTEQRGYAFKLLRGTQEVFINFAQRGMPVRKIYATSERGEGIRMARKLGMKERKYPGDALLRYELDIEGSNHLVLQPCKEALAEWKRRSCE
jgi:predicted DNA-binding transcriptional regulator AlpA